MPQGCSRAAPGCSRLLGAAPRYSIITIHLAQADTIEGFGGPKGPLMLIAAAVGLGAGIYYLKSEKIQDVEKSSKEVGKIMADPNMAIKDLDKKTPNEDEDPKKNLIGPRPDQAEWWYSKSGDSICLFLEFLLQKRDFYYVRS